MNQCESRITQIFRSSALNYVKQFNKTLSYIWCNVSTLTGKEFMRIKLHIPNFKERNPSRECLSSYIESHVVVGGSILKVLAGEVQDILQN